MSESASIVPVYDSVRRVDEDSWNYEETYEHYTEYYSQKVSTSGDCSIEYLTPETFVKRLSISPFADPRAYWHHNNETTEQAWIAAHMLRLIRGWGCQQLADFLDENQFYAKRLGFFRPNEFDHDRAFAPSQSRLYEFFHDELSEGQRDLLRDAAGDAVDQLRAWGVALPDDVFQPEDDTREKRKDERLVERVGEIWDEAKPHITENYDLGKNDNATIHENAHWEMHTYVGMQSEEHANAGATSFLSRSGRDRTPTGGTHRYHLQQIDIEEARESLRATAHELVKRARRQSELQGDLTAAIDITKSNPWHGQTERDGRGQVTEEHLLGYKDSNLYFQWASIQIVGLDIPLVLDARPVRRGESRAEIVDDLLEGAHEVVPSLDLVMMDREFDSEGVKNACEKHRVHYLNPARKQTNERAVCSRLRDAGKMVGFESQQSIYGHDRKRVYLPALNTDVFEPAEDAPDDAGEETIQDELIDDFADVIDVEADEHSTDWYDDILDDYDTPDRGTDEDVEAYALFETNHLDLDLEAADQQALLRKVRRFITRYDDRWGIENGYKQIKRFRVRTTSKDHAYRFFNFTFACSLYNVWRIVDLLVKLEIEDGEPEYSPTVTATTFLEEASDMYGVPPP